MCEVQAEKRGLRNRRSAALTPTSDRPPAPRLLTVTNALCSDGDTLDNLCRMWWAS